MMSKKKPLNLFNQEGMTLIEVSIALMVFSIFIVAFMQGQGGNISTSIKFKQELEIKDLAEMKMNETIIDPPEFRITAGKVDVTKVRYDYKAFKVKGYDDYEYSVNLFKVMIPDFEKITGKTEEEENPNENQSIQKRIFETFRTNMEQLVWQILVTVRHKPTGQTYDLSTWFYNEKGNVQVNIN